MKKSELAKVIREELQGYSKYLGKTKGGTPDEFMQILTRIAKGAEKGDAERGNAILDKANPENVARITRGEKPMYEEKGTLTASEIKEFVKQTLNLQDYDVSVRLNPAYNEITLTIKQDPSEEDFNTVLNYLEDNGYTIDRKQTTREGDDDGDRYYYPRIRFQ
jgi:hypothetical protein